MECHIDDDDIKPATINPKTKACCSELKLPCKEEIKTGFNSCIAPVEDDVKLEEKMDKCCKNNGAIGTPIIASEYKDTCK